MLRFRSKLLIIPYIELKEDEMEARDERDEMARRGMEASCTRL